MKGRCIKESKQLKSEFEIRRGDLKCVAIIEKRQKQYVLQIVYTNQGHLSTQFTLFIGFHWKFIVMI